MVSTQILLGKFPIIGVTTREEFTLMRSHMSANSVENNTSVFLICQNTKKHIQQKFEEYILDHFHLHLHTICQVPLQFKNVKSLKWIKGFTVSPHLCRLKRGNILFSFVLPNALLIASHSHF